MSHEEQQAQHDSVKNIENATHQISNRTLVLLIVAIIGSTATSVAWYFNTKSKDADKNTVLERMIIKNHFQDSLNFIQLQHKLELNQQSNDDHFQRIEERMQRKGAARFNKSARFTGGFVQEHKDPYTGDIVVSAVK